jgi:hypothetical protein
MNLNSQLNLLLESNYKSILKRPLSVIAAFFSLKINQQFKQLRRIFIS